jgi:DNA-binding protein YbaB
MSTDLLNEIKSSIAEMQQHMQKTYSNLSELKLSGESSDKTIKIIMTATYQFEDIELDERAFQGGIKEFKWRLREAWKSLSENIQKTTQEKTIELLQGMQIPEDIRSLSLEDKTEDDAGGETGRG